MTERKPFVCTDLIQYIQEAISRDDFQIPKQNSWNELPPTIQYSKTNNEIMILEQNEKNGNFFFFLWVFNLNLTEYEQTHKIYSLILFDDAGENINISFEVENPFGIHLSSNNNENSIVISNENFVFGFIFFFISNEFFILFFFLISSDFFFFFFLLKRAIFSFQNGINSTRKFRASFSSNF